jgi:hypothetical protein
LRSSDFNEAYILGNFGLTVLGTVSSNAPAQKLVDPDKVAPEFRETAIKQRAEQMKMMDGDKKAEEAKVLSKDRTAHVQHCLDGQQNPPSRTSTLASCRSPRRHECRRGV